VRVETVAEGLLVPWGIAFAPDGRIFVTERPGRIRVIEDGVLRPEPWTNLQGSVATTGEAGLMGIAVAPDFARTGHVFACVTQRRRVPGGAANDVMRFTDRDGSGTEPTIVVMDLPAAMFHAGCAVGFGPDRMLYVTTGDARRPSEAGRQGSLVGKLLRYTAEGGIPADNPFPDSPVYASGLRNAQGLAWHPQTGDLFATEHGPSGFPDERFRRNDDEVNVILRGADYGWPAVAGARGGDRFVLPLAVWSPAVAPSGVAIYNGLHEPWQGSAFVGMLRGQQLQRLALARSPGTRPPWQVTREEVFLDEELGRIRAVAMGPDGYLYITTSNRDGRGAAAPEDDRVLRLIPVP
jgi:glucose/arabinose dehydrogenase